MSGRRSAGLALAAWLAACGGPAETLDRTTTVEPAPPGPPAEMRARVFSTTSELGALAPLLDPSLDLSGRVLVLPGAFLPERAAAVVVVDPTALPDGAVVPAAVVAASSDAAWSYERVIGHVDPHGNLTLDFEHDADGSGWCCSGVAMPDFDRCGPDPPLPPVPAGDDVRVYLFAVPVDAAAHVVVHRTFTLCTRP